MIHTILQILVFQLLFLAVYDLLLKKETFFNLNRTYLLVTPIVGIVLPFISIPLIQQNIPQEYYVQLPAIILTNSVSEVGSRSLFWNSMVSALWIFGIVISTLIFLLKIVKIIRLRS